MTNLSATFFISQTFALSLTDKTFVIWKHPVVMVETFKVKVYLAISRHFPAQPFCPVLVLALAWQLFSSLHLRLVPFLGSSIVQVCLLGLPKCNNFFRVDTSFRDPPIDTPLSRWVNGISGQTNTLSDPPLHVGHGNADYYVIVCRFRVVVTSLR